MNSGNSAGPKPIGELLASADQGGGGILSGDRLENLVRISKEREQERQQAELAKPKQPKQPANKPDLSPPETGSAPRAVYRRCSDITMEKINWLWPGCIVSGEFNLIAGNPGMGKGQITAFLASVVSTGGIWPVSGARCEPGKVIIISAEDSAATTIVPRLKAAGADTDRCFSLDTVVANDKTGMAVKRPFQLTDLNRLVEMIDEIGKVSLIIIDPLNSHMGGINSYKNTDVRSLLQPLGKFAEYYDLAIVGISHLNKNITQGAVQRVGGSGAIVEVPRAAWLVEKDKANPERRLLLPLKINGGNDKNGYAFAFQPVSLPDGIETCRVVWEDKHVTITADEAMTFNPQERDGELERAKRFLAELLQDGRVSASEAESSYQNAGLSRITMVRAKKEAGVVSKKDKDGWFWTLEIKSLIDKNSALLQNNETLETVQQPRGLQTKKNDDFAQESHAFINETLEKNTPPKTAKRTRSEGAGRELETACDAAI